MKHLSTTALALIACASAATAGGLDRGSLPLSALFENGNYAELSFGYVDPNQKGSVGGGAVSSGDINPSYTQFSGAFKYDINDKLSAALMAYVPYGALISYEDAGAGYPLRNLTAKVNSTGIAAIGRYKLDNGFAVHAGVRSVSANAEIKNLGAYSLEAKSSSGFGYIVGASYEKPEIALRAALTYVSKVSMEHDTVENGAVNGKMKFDLPDQIILDFQTGVAADTLVFAQITHSRWTQTVLNGPNFPGNPLVDYDKDTTEFSVGVGRRFNDKLSGSVTIGYEAGAGSTNASNLSPSNGVMSLSVGGKYALNDQIDLSGGITYQKRGSATTETLNANFDNNSLIGVGVKIGFKF